MKPTELAFDGSFHYSCDSLVRFHSDLTKCDSTHYNVHGFYYLTTDATNIHTIPSASGTDHTSGTSTQFMIGQVTGDQAPVAVWRQPFTFYENRVYHLKGFALHPSLDSSIADPWYYLILKDTLNVDTLTRFRLGADGEWIGFSWKLNIDTTGLYFIEVAVAGVNEDWVFFGLDDISVKEEELNLDGMAIRADTLGDGSIKLMATGGFTEYLWRIRPDTLFTTVVDTLIVFPDSLFDRISVIGVNGDACFSRAAWMEVSRMTNCLGNLGVESGNLTGWSGTHGLSSITNLNYPWNLAGTGINHAQVTSLGNDPNIPVLPTVCPIPGYGQHSILLGRNSTGQHAQELTFDLQIDPQAPVLLMAVARVRDITNVTSANTIPARISVILTDLNDNILSNPCIQLSGANPTSSAWRPALSTIQFIPWEQYQLDLTPYLALNSIRVKIANLNDGFGEGIHYSYYDFACSTYPEVIQPPYCANTSPKITVDPAFSYFDIWDLSNNLIESLIPPNNVIQFNNLTVNQVYTITSNSSGTAAISSCEVSSTFTLNPPLSNISSTVNITPPMCAGTATGIATVTVNSGGNPPFNFLWSIIPNVNQNFVNTLTPGTYSVMVSDNAGCFQELQFTMPEGDTFDIQANWDFNCATGCIELGAEVLTQTSGIYQFDWTWGIPGPSTASTSTQNIFHFDNIAICYGMDSGTYPYTVTITDPFGCTDMVSGNLHYLYVAPPPGGLAGADTLICRFTPGPYLDTLTLGDPSLASGFTGIVGIYWIAPDGSTLGGTNPTIVVNTDPTVGQNSGQNSGAGLYILVLVDENGCEYRDSVFINRCCSDLIEPYTMISGGGTINYDFPPNPNSNSLFNYVLDGDFIIDGNLTWGGGSHPMLRFMMLPGSTITITEPNSLHIKTSRLFACDYMWDGFIVEQTNNSNNCTPLLKFENSRLEDATTGIESRDGGSVEILNSLLEDNYVGLRINPFDASFNSNIWCGSVTNTTFRSIQSVPALPWSLLPPYVGYRGNKAIEILGDDVNHPNSKVYFTNSTPGNRVASFDFGIFAEKTGLKVYNWALDSMYSPHGYNNPNTMFNFGIWASGGWQQPIPFEARICSVMNCSNGIRARAYKNFYAYSNFVRLKSQPNSMGISYLNCGTADSISLHFNDIAQCQFGIRGLFSRPGARIRIRMNDIDLYSINRSEGITLQEISSSPIALRVEQNLVSAMFAGISVVGNNAPSGNNLRILNNEVLMNYHMLGVSNTFLNYGIRVASWRNPRINYNQVSGTYGNFVKFYSKNILRGIEINNCSKANVICNNIMNAGLAFIGNQQNPLSVIKNNHFRTYQKGLTVAANGIIGIQGAAGSPSDNLFFDQVVNMTGDLYAWNSGFNTQPFNLLFGRPGAPFEPNSNAALPNTNGVQGACPGSLFNYLCFNATPADSNALLLDCGWVIPGWNNTPASISEFDGPDTAGVINLNWMKAIAADTISYPASLMNSRWMDRLSVYRILKVNLNYLDSAEELSNFYFEYRGSTAQVLDSVLTLLAEEDIESANELFYSWEAGEAPEGEYKRMIEYQLQLERGDDITGIKGKELDDLMELAQKCPEESGESVIWARSILSLIMDSTWMSECEMLPELELTEDDSIDHPGSMSYGGIRVYPNPANEFVIVEFPEVAEDDYQIKIVDLMGILRAEGEILETEWETEINTASLSSGLYILTIWKGSEFVESRQLLIIH